MMAKEDNEICSEMFNSCVFNDAADAIEWCCDYPDKCGTNVPGKGRSDETRKS